MKTAVFSAHSYDIDYLNQANQMAGHELVFFTESLDSNTAFMAANFEVVSAFVIDDLSAPVLEQLAKGGTKLIALRSVGHDNVDLIKADEFGILVVNVPNYSPSAVAEFAVLLLLALARQLRRSGRQFTHNNFALDNLLGVGIEGKTVGIIGSGNIGLSFARIMRGFGCELLAYDPYPNDEAKQYGVRYVTLAELLTNSHFVSLHCPLNDNTKHILNAQTLALMQPNAFLINTARGPIVDTLAVLEALNNDQLAGYAMDVYEQEKGLFFVDHHEKPIKDSLFVTLRDHPKVVLSGHQAFFTVDAITNIAQTTIDNITRYQNGEVKNQVVA